LSEVHLNSALRADRLSSARREDRLSAALSAGRFLSQKLRLLRGRGAN
jgi:hypothetical protein